MKFQMNKRYRVTTKYGVVYEGTYRGQHEAPATGYPSHLFTPLDDKHYTAVYISADLVKEAEEL